MTKRWMWILIACLGVLAAVPAGAQTLELAPGVQLDTAAFIEEAAARGKTIAQALEEATDGRMQVQGRLVEESKEVATAYLQLVKDGQMDFDSAAYGALYSRMLIRLQAELGPQLLEARYQLLEQAMGLYLEDCSKSDFYHHYAIAVEKARGRLAGAKGSRASGGLEAAVSRLSQDLETLLEETSSRNSSP